ncbi:MAG: putative Ig domain-containing protein, partial [Candidatus Gracilibacteria bacterium]|nr:putative Ig domain-containing protein [Candidatus Gracilibacteria bacterium]
GTFNLSVTATDNDGISNSDAFTLTVAAAPEVQVPPIMGDIPNLTVANGGAVNINVSTFTTLTNADPIIAYTLGGDALPTGLSFNTTTGLLSGSSIATGTYNFTVTATDNDGVSNSDSFSITINAPSNTAPTASDFTYSTNVGNSAKTFDWYTLSNATDTNGDTLTASVKTNGTKGVFSISGHNITYTPNASQTGSDTGIITISDGNGGNKDITITVNNVDTKVNAPTFTLPTYTNSTSVNINSLSNDADVVKWYVSVDSSSEVASLTAPTSVNISGEGSHTVKIAVEDATGNKSTITSHTVTLDTSVVSDNSVDLNQVNEGDVINQSLTIPSGESIKIISGATIGGAVIPTTSSYTTSPSVNVTGTATTGGSYSGTITVEDQVGNQKTITINLVVSTPI